MNFSNGKFWLKDPHNLITEMEIIPRKKYSLSKNLNNITRLVIIIFILLIVFKRQYSVPFLLVSLSLIIIIYFLFGKKDNDELLREGFSSLDQKNTREGFKDNISHSYDRQQNSFDNKKSFDNNNYNKMNQQKKLESIKRNPENLVSKQLFQKIMNKKLDSQSNTPVCSPVPYKDGVFFGNTKGYRPWEFSNEDLYQQGVNVNDTYNYDNPNSDGSCCNMKSPEENYSIPKYYTPFVGVNPKMLDPPHLSPRTVEEGYWSYPTSSTANTQVITDLTGEVDIYVDKRKFGKPECNNKALLLEETPTRMYTEAELNTPNNQLFMTTLEPHLYAYDDRIIGINNNSGITYTPEDEPFVRNTVCTNDLKNYPIYTSNTPQFVRENGLPTQQEFQPARTNWSQKQKGLEAGNGSINWENIYQDWPKTNTLNTEGKTYINCKNPKEGYTDDENFNNNFGEERRRDTERSKEGFTSELAQSDFVDSEGNISYPVNGNMEDVYDPRQNGYGDLTRAYANADLGQISYYYSDITSHRYPNFFGKSKIDHILFTDPQGKTSPYYQSEVSLDDIKEAVEDDWLSKSSLFREDLMSLQMRKRNAEMIQLRISPLQRSQHTSTFTNKY